MKKQVVIVIGIDRYYSFIDSYPFLPYGCIKIFKNIYSTIGQYVQTVLNIKDFIVVDSANPILKIYEKDKNKKIIYFLDQCIANSSAKKKRTYLITYRLILSSLGNAFAEEPIIFPYNRYSKYNKKDQVSIISIKNLEDRHGLFPLPICKEELDWYEYNFLKKGNQWHNEILRHNFINEKNNVPFDGRLWSTFKSYVLNPDKDLEEE